MRPATRALVVVAFVIFTTGAAQAQEVCNWVGNTSDWFDIANWSCGGNIIDSIPNAPEDTANILSATTANPNLTSDVQVGVLNFTIPLTISSGTFLTVSSS